MDREEGESGDKVAEAKSYIFLYDANYQKIADLLEYDSLYKDEIGIDAENKTPYKIAIIVFYKGVSHFNYVIAVYVFI